MPRGGEEVTLRPDGKPMRALAALEVTDPDHNLDEVQVWVKARRDDDDTATWHSALASLVAHGYARRIGQPGGYRWFITPAGRTVLRASRQEKP